MNYYLLRLASDPKITGLRNGGMQAEIKEKYFKDPRNYHKLMDFFMSSNYWKNDVQYPDFDVKIHAKMEKSAKETDFLMFGQALTTCSFMLSDKVAEIFKKFNISDYKLYPVDMHPYSCLKSKKKYWLFCSPFLNYDIVDFQQSIFYTGNDLLKNKKYQPDVKSWEDYRTFSSKMSGFLEIEVLKFNSKFDDRLDYFQCRVGEIQISERLKDALIEAGATGVKILDIGPRIIVSET